MKTNPDQSFITLSPEQTLAWLNKYRYRYRKGTIAFALVLFIIIMAALIIFAKDLETETLIMYIVFSGVGISALTLFSLNQMKKEWVGIIKNKHYSRKVVVYHNDGGHGSQRIVEEFVLYVDIGKKLLKVTVGKKQYHYFREGDRIFKLSGFQVPELCTLRDQKRLCISCGKMLEGNQLSRCSKCRQPIPDLLTLVKAVGFDDTIHNTAPDAIRNNSFCSCGAFLSNNLRFCETCGKQVAV